MQIDTRESWFRVINDTFGSVSGAVNVFFGTLAAGGRDAVTYNIFTVTDDVQFTFSGTPYGKMLPFTLDLTIDKPSDPRPIISWPASLINPPTLPSLTDNLRLILHFETVRDAVSERQIYVGGSVGGVGAGPQVEIDLGEVENGQDVDWSLANKFRCVMIGDTTFSMINTPPNVDTWQRIVLEARQDAIGGHTASFADTFENDHDPITRLSPNSYSIWSFYASNRGTQPIFSFNTLQFYSITYSMSDEKSPLDPASVTDPFSTFGAETAFVVNEVKARVRTAPLGSDLTIDIHVNGTSILSTKITIEDGEFTSVDAITQPVIIPASAEIGNDDLIELFLDTLDMSNIATGLKLTMGGHVI